MSNQLPMYATFRLWVQNFTSQLLRYFYATLIIALRVRITCKSIITDILTYLDFFFDCINAITIGIWGKGSD